MFSGDVSGAVLPKGSLAAWPRSPTRREFSIINTRLNTVERGYQAKVYKFNNRKDDAVFSKDSEFDLS